MKLIEHIGIWENSVPADACEEYINFFKKFTSHTLQNYRVEDQESNLICLGADQFNEGGNGRRDFSIFLNLLESPYGDATHQYLQPAFLEYAEIYPELKSTNLTSIEIKMQMTPPGGGYHIWHSERFGTPAMGSRQMAWMIYLNDMPEGEAETEFMYQKLRVKPTVGTVLIWPASYTHLHRGNPPHTQDKYILTGWFTSVYDNG